MEACVYQKTNCLFPAGLGLGLSDLSLCWPTNKSSCPYQQLGEVRSTDTYSQPRSTLSSSLCYSTPTSRYFELVTACNVATRTQGGRSYLLFAVKPDRSLFPIIMIIVWFPLSLGEMTSFTQLSNYLFGFRLRAEWRWRHKCSLWLLLLSRSLSSW